VAVDAALSDAEEEAASALVAAMPVPASARLSDAATAIPRRPKEREVVDMLVPF
jgi:hypothetical protein